MLLQSAREELQVERSRALAPLFYRAPHPANMTPGEYQHAGVEYALDRDHCLIGDAPGVGKTAQGILISNAIEAKKTLVVCPASLRLNWRDELWKWSTIPNVHVNVIIKGSDGVNPAADYTVVSYDLLRNGGVLAALLQQRWDHMILDEAHALKDPKGNKRTQAICAEDRLRGVAGRITLLSGTILPNQPIEVYNAARLLNWDAIDRMSLEDFRNHYYDVGQGMSRRYVWDEAKKAMVSKIAYGDVRNVPRNLEELQWRLRANIMVRRTKDDVLPQLPQKRYHVVPLTMTADMRSALKHPGWNAASKLFELDPDNFAAQVPIDGEVSTARRMLGEAKCPAVLTYIDDLLAEGVEKLLVTAHHTSVLKAARERLTKYGLAFMDGSTPATKRHEEAKRFQSDPSCRVILGQTQVIGEGFTLTAAQDCVLMEPDWVPGRIEQAVDRLHRRGQEGGYVLAHVPVIPGTLDERVIAMAVRKDVSIYAALDKR